MWWSLCSISGKRFVWDFPTSSWIFRSGGNGSWSWVCKIPAHLVCDLFLIYLYRSLFHCTVHHVHITSRFLISSHEPASCLLYLLLFFSSTVACCPLVGLCFFPCLSCPRSQLLGCADTWLATIIPVLWVSPITPFPQLLGTFWGLHYF